MAVNEVHSFLKSVGLGKYAPKFQAHEFDMRSLLLVTDEDLSEMGIPKGPRLKLLNAAAALRMLEGGGMSSDDEVEPGGSLGEMTEAQRRAAHQAEMDSLFEKMRQEEQQQTLRDEAALEQEAAAERAAAAERRAAVAAERAAAEADRQRKAEEKKRKAAERRSKEKQAAAAAREAAAAEKKVKDAARATKAAEQAKQAAAAKKLQDAHAAEEAAARERDEAAAAAQRERAEAWRRAKRQVRKWLKKHCPASELCTVFVVFGLVIGSFMALLVTEEFLMSPHGVRLLDGSRGRLPQSEQIADELELLYSHLQASGAGPFSHRTYHDTNNNGVIDREELIAGSGGMDAMRAESAGRAGDAASSNSFGSPADLQLELDLALAQLTTEELRAMLSEHQIELPEGIGIGEDYSHADLLEFVQQPHPGSQGDTLQTWKTWIDSYETSLLGGAGGGEQEGCAAGYLEDEPLAGIGPELAAMQPIVDRASEFKDVGMDVLEALALATLEDIVAQAELVAQRDASVVSEADGQEELSDGKQAPPDTDQEVVAGKDAPEDEPEDAADEATQEPEAPRDNALSCTGPKPCAEFEQKWRKVLKPRWKRALDGIPDARMSISELKAVALSQSVRKFDAAFEYLDVNKDMQISTDELFGVFDQRQPPTKGATAGDDGESALVTLHMPQHWMDSALALGETLERLRLDFNGDGRIEYTEATQLYILLTFARQLDAAKQLLLSEAEAAAVDRQQLEEELGDGQNIATVGDDGEPLMVAMLAIPWDARPGDELKVPPPLEQFTEIGGYPAAKDGYTFVVPPGTRGGDLAKLPVATPEEAGQVVFQVEGYGRDEQVLTHRATGGEQVSGSGAAGRGVGQGSVSWTWTGRLPIGGGGGLGGAAIEAEAFTYDGFNAYVPVEYHFACPANAAPGEVVGFQLHGVDKSTWYRLPPACADRDHFYGLQHLDELTAAFEYCALAAEVVSAQPTPFGALARLYRDAGLDTPAGTAASNGQPYRGLALLTNWVAQVARVHRMPKSLDSIAAAWNLSGGKSSKRGASGSGSGSGIDANGGPEDSEGVSDDDMAAAYAARQKAQGAKVSVEDSKTVRSESAPLTGNVSHKELARRFIYNVSDSKPDADRQTIALDEQLFLLRRLHAFLDRDGSGAVTWREMMRTMKAAARSTTDKGGGGAGGGGGGGGAGRSGKSSSNGNDEEENPTVAGLSPTLQPTTNRARVRCTP